MQWFAMSLLLQINNENDLMLIPLIRHSKVLFTDRGESTKNKWENREKNWSV